jgi:predicted Co/Zn/Cd cation transporter (cation efflux family)
MNRNLSLNPQRIKWMIGFALIAIVGGVAAFSFEIPAAGVVALICLILALLLLASRIFERTASA